MVDEEIQPEGSGQNMVLQEAVEALRRGERARARDLLTRLLKTEQNNAMCWVWLSAAVDTQKERLYCLQTALQLDPQNASAKRGLTLLGGLPPDDAVPPFPLNHPRQWEEKLDLPQEPKEKTHGFGRSLVRLFAILAVSMAVLGVAYFGFLAPNAILLPYLNRPRRLFVTITFTPTGTLSTAIATHLPEPTPLEMLLATTYTPTPIYVATPHPVTTRSAFEAGLRFFAAHDYQNAIAMFKQVLNAEPQAADVYYYIGESYRMQTDYIDARVAYQSAINYNPDFAPAYLGRAQVNLGIKPDADVSSDLDATIDLDSHFTAAFIERADYRRTHNDQTGSMADLQTALELNPDSALAYLVLAELQLDEGQYPAALASATKANQIDLTMIPAYLVLAQAYIANGQIDQATGALQTYVRYAPQDIDALLTLATVYNAIGQYQPALEAINRYINDNPKSAPGYTQRGYANLGLKNNSLAEIDFKAALNNNPAYFDGYLGLGQAYFAEGHANNAYIVVDQNCGPLATNDAQRAQIYYWEAIFLDGMNEKDASLASWHRLLDLSPAVMPAAWRDAAFLHLGISPSPTSSWMYTLTPTEATTPTP